MFTCTKICSLVHLSKAFNTSLVSQDYSILHGRQYWYLEHPKCKVHFMHLNFSPICQIGQTCWFQADRILLSSVLSSSLICQISQTCWLQAERILLCSVLSWSLICQTSQAERILLSLFCYWPNPICQEPSFIDQTGCLGKILDPLLLTRSVFSSGTSNFSGNATVPGIILPLNYPQYNIVRPLLPPIVAKNQGFIAL